MVACSTGSNCNFDSDWPQLPVTRFCINEPLMKLIAYLLSTIGCDTSPGPGPGTVDM